MKRLYIFTGKGGVGKTTLALAFAKYLHSRKKKVLYNNADQIINSKLCNKLKIPYIHMEIATSIEKYISSKLKSDIIASWIMKTPFAKSLFNIIPGIGYMIFLGHIIWMLEQDEDLTIVMDSQSSGHAITMFESPYNFKKIFGTGIVVNDIHKITSFMTNPDKIKVFVANLANPMSVSEGDELKNYLKKLSTPNIQLIMNNTFGNIPEIERSGKLPKFINKKILLEKKVYKSYQKQDIYILPHMIDSSQEKIIQKLVPYAEKLM
ncbi:MAG: AAA family ATPase [Bacteriovoracaceae bacterium]|nr:AAA family ATPase [Bacteriovoracaceae bacterium]